MGKRRPSSARRVFASTFVVPCGRPSYARPLKLERLDFTFVLGVFLGLGYLAAALIGWAADVTDGDGSDLAFWLLFLGGGGVLLLVALFVVSEQRAVAAGLAIAGALAGALALFWSVVVPLAAIAFVVLVALRLRSGRPLRPAA